jgi:uncharacterized membrane protein YqjE
MTAGAEVALADLERGRDEARELGAQTAEIAADVRELVRLEMELAKAEVAENRSRLMQGALGIGLATLFGFWLFGFLGWAAMSALAEVWPMWAAALATAGIWLVLAGIAVAFARMQLKEFNPTPERTLASLREDVAWARGLLKPNGVSGRNGR